MPNIHKVARSVSCPKWRSVPEKVYPKKKTREKKPVVGPVADLLSSVSYTQGCECYCVPQRMCLLVCHAGHRCLECFRFMKRWRCGNLRYLSRPYCCAGSRLWMQHVETFGFLHRTKDSLLVWTCKRLVLATQHFVWLRMRRQHHRVCLLVALGNIQG